MIPRREIPLTPAPTWESMLKILSPVDNPVKRKNDIYILLLSMFLTILKRISQLLLTLKIEL